MAENPRNTKKKANESRLTKSIRDVNLLTILAIEEGIKEGTIISPLDYLIQLYQSTDETSYVRLAAAKAALPYLHSSKPTELKQTISSTDTLFEINLVDIPRSE